MGSVRYGCFLIPLLLILIYKLAGVMHWFEGRDGSNHQPDYRFLSYGGHGQYYVKQYNQDAAYGGQLVAVTTILSIVTLPLVVMVAQLIGPAPIKPESKARNFFLEKFRAFCFFQAP